MIVMTEVAEIFYSKKLVIEILNSANIADYFDTYVSIFGFYLIYELSKSVNHLTVNTEKPIYMAPEVISQTSYTILYYGDKVDGFTFLLVLNEVFTEEVYSIT